MGREVKRVALDFNWPIDEIYSGYVNPLPTGVENCSACDGSGYSTRAKLFSDQWYGNADFDPVAYGSQYYRPDDPIIVREITRKIEWSIELAKQGELPDYYTQGGRIPLSRAVLAECRRMTQIYNTHWMYHLSEDDVQALIASDEIRKQADGSYPTREEIRNSMIGSGSFHGSGFNWTCIKGRCAREGIPYLCSQCDGSGEITVDEALKDAYEAWEETEPPEGSGWQIWETVSEGSPISPVFATAEELAEHMANEKPWGASEAMSAERWLKWITGPGWAPSLIGNGSTVVDGVFGMTEK